MTDTANAPERKVFDEWFQDTFKDPDGSLEHLPKWFLEDAWFIWKASATHCDELVAAARAEGAREAQAKLDELRSDRPFIVGWNEGFAEAEYQQAHGKPSDGDLSPQYQHTAKEVAEAQAKIARLTEALIDVIMCDHHNFYDGPPPRFVQIARAALQENANG